VCVCVISCTKRHSDTILLVIFPVNRELPVASIVVLIHFFEREPFEWDFLLSKCTFCHPTNSHEALQRIQSTDLNLEKIHWHLPFLIHHLIDVGSILMQPLLQLCVATSQIDI